MDNTLSPDAFAEILAAAEAFQAVCAKHGAHANVASPGPLSFHSGGPMPEQVGVVEERVLSLDDRRWVCRTLVVGGLTVDVHLAAMREAV